MDSMIPKYHINLPFSVEIPTMFYGITQLVAVTNCFIAANEEANMFMNAIVAKVHFLPNQNTPNLRLLNLFPTRIL